MSDLISRSALLAEYDRVHVGAPGGARKLMEDAPTVDAVPVVRCKDCKHLMFSDCYGECGQGHMGIVKPWDFCSYGKREGNES